MKTLKIYGHTIYILTDQEAEVHRAPITIRFDPRDKWGIHCNLNKGDMFELLTGRSRFDGKIDFALPEDWIAAQPDPARAIRTHVWDYTNKHAFGEPLNLESLLPQLKQIVMMLIIEGSLPEDLEYE